MKTENLKIGMIIKNYKEMCSLLEESIKTGESKQCQLKEWSRYFNWTKEGNKFIIGEVYTMPKEKEDKRIMSNKNGKNNKYIEEIKDILVNYIYENRDIEGKVIISFSKLINILGMVNDTYSIANSRKRELSDILNIELKAVYYFYNNTRSELKNIVERALNNLKKRSVIHYNSIVMIAEKSKNNKKKLVYRKAENNEIQMILDTQRMILEEMGLKDLQELFLSGNAKYKEFNKMLMLELPRDWKFFFNAYEIISGDYSIKSEYNITQRKRELNNKSVDRMTVLLKANDENTNEKKLIDLLISLIKHDFKLDEQIKDLYDVRKTEKDNKIKSMTDDIINLRSKQNSISMNIDVTCKLYEERDAISKYDLYSYSNQIKNRDNLFDIENDAEFPF